MKHLLHQLSLGKKILLAPVVVLVFLIVLGLGTFMGLWQQQEITDDMYKNRFRNYQVSANLLKDLATVQGNIARIINWVAQSHDPAEVERVIKNARDVLAADRALVDEMVQRKELLSEERKLFQEVAATLKEYEEAAGRVLELAPQGMGAVYAAVADGKYALLELTLMNLLRVEERLSRDGYNKSVSAFNLTMIILVSLYVTLAIMSLITSLIMMRNILRPIKDVIAHIRLMAEGDLTVPMTTTSQDEIGELVEAVNLMRAKMSEAVGQALQVSGTLSDASAREAASIQETSASLDEIASMARQNAKNTGEASNHMLKVQEAVRRVNDSMGGVTQSMHAIYQASEQTQKIVKSINEIAFQTNLLALNASVEAAGWRIWCRFCRRSRRGEKPRLEVDRVGQEFITVDRRHHREGKIWQ